MDSIPRKPAKKRSSSSLKNTAQQYASVSTIHGISYILDPSQSHFPRFLWILIVLAMSCLFGYWCIDAYNSWRDDPVLTSVKTTGLPISELEFPAITICSQGTVDEVLKRVQRFQLQEFAKRQNKSLEDLNATEIEVLENELQSQLYPGSEQRPEVLVNAMVASSPENVLTSTILVDGGYDVCQNQWNSTSAETCPTGWTHLPYFALPAFENTTCMREAGSGTLSMDKCLDRDGELISLKDDNMIFDLWTLLTTDDYINQNYSGKFFWIDAYYDKESEQFFMYGNGNNLSDFFYLVDMTATVNTVNLTSATDTWCMKAWVDPDISYTIFYAVTSCLGDVAEFICTQELIQCDADSGSSTRRKRATADADADEWDSSGLDLIFNPVMEKEKERLQKLAITSVRESFQKMDLKRSYPAMFELMWYSQLPCYDIADVTSSEDQQFGMLKWCAWKGEEMPCSRLFNKFPTDRGMCCSFNMERANEMFQESVYRSNMKKLQKRDKQHSFENEPLPKWWHQDKEPVPEPGRTKGLEVVLDAHTDLLTGSSVSEDFQGFTAVIDSRSQYPLTARKAILLRPGHENIVTISATKISSNDNIRSTEPDRRRCYFPEEKPLLIHKHYSQANCLLECQLKFTINAMNITDQCIPWYFPFLVANNRMCDPWEARLFEQISKAMPNTYCSECQPDCDETHYVASVTAAPFRRCDFKNLDLSPLCDLDDNNRMNNPPIWGQSVLEEYKKNMQKVPSYVKQQVKSNLRRHVTSKQQKDKSVFSVFNAQHPTYDAYDKDIARVSFFFDSSSVFEYSRQARLTWVGFISQIGGLLGLCLGCSFVSLIEIVYWFTFRFGLSLR